MALNPDVKTALEAMYASGWKDPSTLAPEQARKQARYYSELRIFPRKLDPITICDIKIPREQDNFITARVYYPEKSAKDFAVIFYHGGGYVLGSVAQHDMICRWLCSELKIPFISVDYRLAPEFPFPIPVEDGYAALEWITNNATSLNLQDKEIILVGDSAGAHLATMNCLLARDRQGPKIASQWLFYPWVDDNFQRPSYQKYATGFGLSKMGMQWFTQQFLQPGHASNYPAFPLAFDNFSHLPPAHIFTAECDVLHDEGQVYAETLKAAGNKLQLTDVPGMIHGFLGMYPVPACYNVGSDIIKILKKNL